MAKNYNLSDYALNKYSESMVYIGTDGAYALTKEAFLASDSTLTEADFVYWKRLSDSNYRETAKRNTFESKHTVPLTEIADTALVSAENPEDEVLEEMEPTSNPYSYENAIRIIDSCLTGRQKVRYLQHFAMGISTRDIAVKEGAHYTSIAESIRAAEKKIKKYLKKF